MSYDQSHVAFIDTETGGLDPEHHGIWEIAVIVDGVEHVWQQQLPLDRQGDPDLEAVSPWVLENTRFKQDYDHDEALTPLESLAKLEELVRGRHLVGACPWFDSERLHRVQLAESDHRDLLWHYHLIDVENMAVGWLKAGAQRDGWLYIPRELLALKGPPELIEQIRLVKPDLVTPPPIVANTNPPPWDCLPWKSEDLSFALGVDPADFEPKHSALADARWAKAMYEAMMGDPE